MALSPIVPGKIAPRHMLVNIPRLVSAYYTQRPRPIYPDKPNILVEFGTSGHRGSSLKGTFNEMHIRAITQAICEYRAKVGITGSLYIGFDTHALSEPALRTALEVLAANKVNVVTAKGDEYSPTPVISRMIINANRGKTSDLADGIIITPSHNGPQDGGFKYNLPHGGPADTDVTGWIQDRANVLISWNNAGVNIMPFETARVADTVRELDLITPFVDDLASVIDFKAIRDAKIRIGGHPLGGAGGPYLKANAGRKRGA